MRFYQLAIVSLALFFSMNATAQINDKQFADMLKKYLSTDAGQELIGETVKAHFQKQQEQAKKGQAERQKADLENQFKNPVKIDAGNSPFIGPKDASVTVIEFSDFQCPYCSRGAKTMKELLDAYPKDVRVVFKNLPLEFHPQAMPAAKAALAAHRQGKFWEMHDKLFDNQRQLKEEAFIKFAKELGLNLDQFKKDMKDPEIEKTIKADTAIAQKHGIKGTPGFFVNGVAVKGAYPISHFKSIVDRWLAKK